MIYRSYVQIGIILLGLNLKATGGHTQEALPYDFPKPVDTRSKPIQIQDKKTWSVGSVQVSNQFDGARLNKFSQKNDSTFVAHITPENIPINPSPWYAFKMWSSHPKQIWLEFQYAEAAHRYHPKISTDGLNWHALDSAAIFRPDSTSNKMSYRINLSTDTLWVAAQEIINSTHVADWCFELAKHPEVKYGIAGLSRLGRNIPFLDIGTDSVQNQDMIVLLSRQHPPEVTGYMALQAFLETILADNPLANSFRKKYRILVFPLMNPDGVDLGHWRHNAGGVDLNRDWAYYLQPETRQVADFIVRTSKAGNHQVILGLDFHSTYYDIYYTCQDTNRYIPGFKDFWLQGMSESIPDYTPRIEPSGIEQPISKTWFLTQFGAEGITYEIGDDTPRDFIALKGHKSAIEMMQLLIFRR